MKRLLLLATLLFPASLQAVPGTISYQGIVTDPAGVPIGDTSPENREAIFRIWKVATGGGQADLVFSGQQTVTIANGEFSVLIGTGSETEATASALDESGLFGPAALAAAFDGGNRFLEVTIADGSGSLTTPITPRQQIVSTAYAMRAGEAENAQSFGLGDGSIVYDEGTQTMTLATAGTTRLTIDANGRTTLGVAGATNQALDVYRPSYYHDVLAFSDPDDGQPDRIGMYFDTSNDSLRFEDNYRSILLMSLTDTGNLGIGTPTPAQKLDVRGNAYVSGSVGIGTVDPDAKLHVRDGDTGATPNSNAVMVVEGTGGNATWLNILGQENEEVGILLGHSASSAIGALLWNDSQEHLQLRAGGSTRMVVEGNGNVGIGINNPGTPLEVSGSQLVTESGVYFANSNTSLSTTSGSTPISISASHWLKGAGFLAVSDERIKEIKGSSDAEKDLRLIEKLRVTDYEYIDKVSQGSSYEKKLIAQQVEKVYPQAVAMVTGVVPDVYKRADVGPDGWIQLENDLMTGDRVRIIAKKSDTILEVTEVNPEQFRLADSESLEGEVFVYGREVDDFRTVDYDAISMLNVSATQELHRRLQESESEVEALKERIAELEARDRARDERLSAIEALLKPSDREAPRTVSVK